MPMLIMLITIQQYTSTYGLTSDPLNSFTALSCNLALFNSGLLIAPVFPYGVDVVKGLMGNRGTLLRTAVAFTVLVRDDRGDGWRPDEEARSLSDSFSKKLTNNSENV